MKIQILDKTKKKKFIEGISNFGVSKISELLIRTGGERVRAYSGNLSTDEIMGIWRILPIEGVGLYVGKDLIDRALKQAKKFNVPLINKEVINISKKKVNKRIEMP